VKKKRGTSLNTEGGGEKRKKRKGKVKVLQIQRKKGGPSADCKKGNSSKKKKGWGEGRGRNSATQRRKRLFLGKWTGGLDGKGRKLGFLDHGVKFRFEPEAFAEEKRIRPGERKKGKVHEKGIEIHRCGGVSSKRGGEIGSASGKQ